MEGPLRRVPQLLEHDIGVLTEEDWNRSCIQVEFNLVLKMKELLIYIGRAKRSPIESNVTCSLPAVEGVVEDLVLAHYHPHGGLVLEVRVGVQ